jgi:propanol-preferring alcohol dehydrogenase
MPTVLQLAAEGRVGSVIDRFPLDEATEVLGRLERGELRSRAVLVP